jgi:methylated-DNA-[protein]-cysteine S-methyltransferase
MAACLCFHLFDTALGACALAWSEKGLVRILLPEKNEQATRARMRALLKCDPTEGVPPAWVTRAETLIRAHLAGERADLSSIPLDLGALSPFARKVYQALRKVPAGQVVSYGQLAKMVRSPAAARAVGRAMAANPLPIVIPCHRVVAADGQLGGFSAHGGVGTKIKLLELEGDVGIGG